MTRCFNRSYRVEIGVPGSTARVFTGLRCNFSIKKTDNREPDEGVVELYNLASDSRTAIAAEGNILRLFAGYADPLTAPSAAEQAMIFSGDIGKYGVEHKFETPDVRTVITARDGGVTLWRATLTRTYAGAQTAVSLLTAICKDAGLQSPDIIMTAPAVYPHGYTVDGPVRNAFDAVCRASGAVWRIADGRLVVTPRGAVKEVVAARLTPATGLVGSVEWADKKRSFRCTCLLRPDVRPGGQVAIESREFTGAALVRAVEHRGDTHGNDWYSVIEADV